PTCAASADRCGLRRVRSSWANASQFPDGSPCAGQPSRIASRSSPRWCSRWRIESAPSKVRYAYQSMTRSLWPPARCCGHVPTARVVTGSRSGRSCHKRGEQPHGPEPATERCEGCLRPSCAAHLGEIPLTNETSGLDILALLCDACAQEAL